MESWKCEGEYIPAFSVKSAQAVGNTRDDFRSFEREGKSAKERAVCAPVREFARGKKEWGKSLADRDRSAEMKESRGVKICCGRSVCAKRAVGLGVEGKAARDLEGIRPLPFPSVMLQESSYPIR